MQKKAQPIRPRPSFKHVIFLGKYKEKQYVCVNNSLTEGVFVTELSSDAKISV